MNTFIGQIAEQSPYVKTETKNYEIDQLFNQNPNLQGIVIVTDDKTPVAHITRSRFYQTLGTLYGYNLYMNRSIDLLMNKKPLIVHYSESITKVSQLAMKRHEEEIYDDVIVVKDKKFFGTVSIRNLLIKFSEIQSELASFLNPLTGLPGNKIIEEMLKKTIQQTEFSVLYLDLDCFKAYNDNYGFKKGDQVIQETATILKNNFDSEGGFLAHIGGDDFIGFLNHHVYHNLCEHILHDFNRKVKHFYHKTHLEQQYVIAENRLGEKEKFPLLSLSIAVVTNEANQYNEVEDIVNEATRLKKICKKQMGSVYMSGHFLYEAPQ